ncbi:fungal hydrophobin [Penicillium macrosclerotiorum]|uniref:fungal hydrophobin n=1 Tax=Penicillium macrosclerotiorum TaxID=303699 RepID=UPI0025485F11|nr:fungal hydrophobin [Penicillium macrosclerotiorum]KAJ5698729.1 fungal hydrophobin [Penicillium macrosclerotiorum]
MRFSIISAFSLIGAGMVSALPSEGSIVAPVKRSSASTESKVQEAAAALAGNKVENESETSDCVGSLLCCGSLTTPLDHIVDPILEDLGIDAANIVGSIGLLCDPYEASTCDSAPQCCTEANLLGGTLALGCSALKK